MTSLTESNLVEHPRGAEPGKPGDRRAFSFEQITRMESEFLDFMDANHPEIGASIRDEKKITDENEAALKKAIVEFKDTFIVSEGR